jgi:hypothetical protein
VGVGGNGVLREEHDQARQVSRITRRGIFERMSFSPNWSITLRFKGLHDLYLRKSGEDLPVGIMVIGCAGSFARYHCGAQGMFGCALLSEG